jgi:hypothetical protein
VQTDPWTAKAVLIKASDAVGTSAFNWFGMWSDNYFAHPSADYYTGNFTIRTPLDTYTPTAATPSFTFVGDSLTVNNKGNSSSGLIFNGKGTTGVLTFKNLVLDGGTIHQQSTVSDLFQFAGKLNIASASTIAPELGNINILADVSGVGNLTVGNTSINDGVNGVVRLMSTNNTYKGSINVLSRLEFTNGADMNFVIGNTGINNAITGASAKSVTLDGVFNLNLTSASANNGDLWSLVTAANTHYGPDFNVANFAEISSGLWSNGSGYLFSESTGRLTFDPAFNLGVSEPASLTLLVLGALGIAWRRRTACRLS